jgi:hypothetical protein
MASPSTFTHLDVGARFSVDGYPAREDGTAHIFIKTGDATATDTDGRAWSFADSQGLLVHER